MFTSRIDCLTAGLLLFVMVQFSCAVVPESQCLETCRLFQNEKFNNHCPKEGSCDWQCAAQRMNCLRPSEYHCAREDGHPELRFGNVCAIPKQCRIGEEPAISFTNTRAEVICTPCIDKHFYNDRANRTSSTFSRCLDKKYSHCTKENHKIDCGPERQKQAWDVQTEGDGFCRCDARGGYEPKFKDVLDEGEYCFDKKVECVQKDCGPGMELSLNYQCIPKCAEGLVRTQLSDICSQLEVSSSTATPVSVIPTSTNGTEYVTRPPNPASTAPGTSSHVVDKYVVAGSVTVTLVCIIGIIVYIVYRRRKNKERNKEKTVDKGVGKPLLPNSPSEMLHVSEGSGRSSDSIKTQEPQPSKQENTTIYNVQGDFVQIQNERGKVNIHTSGDDKMTILAKKTGTGIDEELELSEYFRSKPSNSAQVLPTDHGSSTESAKSCHTVAGMIPSPAIVSKEGPDLRPGVQTDIREALACHPSDAEDTLPENIPASNHEEVIKPFGFTKIPETFEDDGFIDAVNVDGGSLSDEEMEKLAEELLNTLNRYLKIFAALNENNLATITSNLKKIAAENKVNLESMLIFRMCVEKPSTRTKDVFKCKHCGMKFIRGSSYGNNNSCMYQSISKLLCGEVRLQNRLRLCSSLHAIRRFKHYVKQLEAFAGREKSPYNRVLEILAPAGVDTSGIQDWKLWLSEGIRQLVVETSESTRDCNQIHIMFLSHALRCKITQHFEDNANAHHEDTEDCPVFEEDMENSSDILDLHILWSAERNHLMPLFQK